MNAAWAFLFLSLASLQGASGAVVDEKASLAELFTWGEYDSLIRILEPRMVAVDGKPVERPLATRADSLEEARASLYLGVAYWATGRSEQGSRSFSLAARLDEDLRLDPLYATPEMAARFEQIAEAERNRAAPSPAPVAASTAPPGPGRAEPRSRTRGALRAVWTGAAFAGAAGVVAGAYILVRSLDKPKEIVTVVDPEKDP